MECRQGIQGLVDHRVRLKSPAGSWEWIPKRVTKGDRVGKAEKPRGISAPISTGCCQRKDLRRASKPRRCDHQLLQGIRTDREHTKDASLPPRPSNCTIELPHPNPPSTSKATPKQWGQKGRRRMEVEEGDEGGKGAMRTARRRLRQVGGGLWSAGKAYRV